MSNMLLPALGLALVLIACNPADDKSEEEKNTDDTSSTASGTVTGSTTGGTTGSPAGSGSPAGPSGPAGDEEGATTSGTKKVLLIIANDGFYYQEYSDPRTALEAGGFAVTVAAGRLETAVPHAGTGQPDGVDGSLTPDLALTSVNSSDYEALVIAGGWGASSYQFAFDGTIDNPAWQADPAIAARANELIGEFLAAGKYVVGICHGVSVLAWARVDGVSPLNGKNVTASDIGSPAQTYNGVHYNDYELASSQLVADNGAVVAPANSVGDPSTPADDVIVDGLIVTGQNQHSALQAGQKLVELLNAQAAAAE